MKYRQNTIKNKAVVDFNILGKCCKIESNEVEAKKIALTIVKEQSANLVCAGDKIIYKVVICNESCVDLYDLDFRDRLDSDIHYERNTFTYNGACVDPVVVGRDVCYHINCLKANEDAVITFEVEVE